MCPFTSNKRCFRLKVNVKINDLKEKEVTFLQCTTGHDILPVTLSVGEDLWAIMRQLRKLSSGHDLHIWELHNCWRHLSSGTVKESSDKESWVDVCVLEEDFITSTWRHEGPAKTSVLTWSYVSFQYRSGFRFSNRNSKLATNERTRTVSTSRQTLTQFQCVCASIWISFKFSDG